MIDTRIGADGKTYLNAGEAVRGQYNYLNLNVVKEKERITRENLFNKSTITSGQLLAMKVFLLPLLILTHLILFMLVD
ncbi:hypothetical protein [Clostridium sp.]|uniref:hypothetical protein n=1 Tax=Clostridium sp. TaxID=1506 RepID=UPI003D6D4567